MRNPIVYVTQTPPNPNPRGRGPVFDISPAARFGTIKILCNRAEIEEATTMTELLWKFRERMIPWDSSLDYILPLGHTITMIAAALVALEKGDGRLRILQWDRRLKEYEMFLLDVHAQPLGETLARRIV